MEYPNKIFLRNYPRDEKEVWSESRQSPDDTEYIKREFFESSIEDIEKLLDSTD